MQVSRRSKQSNGTVAPPPCGATARLALAHMIALRLGWCLFGDFLRASTGLEDLDDRMFASSAGQTVASILGAEYRGGK